jgi:1-acyl-sn-glycerol-3-phosphate acyltransferase
MIRSITSPGVRSARLARFFWHFLHAIAVAAFIYPFIDQAARRRRLKRWSAQLLRVLEIRKDVHGEPPDVGVALIVANHVSWLDIFAINAVRPTRFVAKSEIRRWPVIGWLCARGDTLFIDRTRWHHTRDVNAVMAAAMQAGDTFAVFPEGFTTHGDVLLPFHASLLQPALTCDAKIYPVAIRYSRDDGSLCTEADYEGEKSLAASLLQLITQRRVHLALHFLPPIDSTGMHRRELADEAAHRIAARLGLAAPSRRAGTARDPTA